MLGVEGRHLVGLDVDALEPFLEAHVELAGPLTGRLIAGGRSNLTYEVTDGVARWVLRRPPLGHVLASAHDMAREFRVMSALGSSAVPVPRMVARCVDATVIGSEFYVMEFVDGVIVRTREQLAELGEHRGAAVLRTLAETLASLHAVDPAAVGLADFGRPDGFAARQVRTWVRQLESSKSRELPGLENLAARLAATVPDNPRRTIVHGDYRLDNCVLAPSLDRVGAVLDWEMAALGDPLLDLASLMVWWDGLRGLDSPIAAVPADHLAVTADTALEAYASASGLDADAVRGAMPWYLGFAYFKLGAIFEGIHYRSLQGQTVGEGFDQIGALTLPMIERGRAVLDGV